MKQPMWGFDLTDFSSPKNFLKFLLKAKISPRPRKTSKCWEWKGKDVTLETTSNPITGEHYSYPDERWQPNTRIGYASYTTVIGKTNEDVARVVYLLKKFAWSKDESPGSRY